MNKNPYPPEAPEWLLFENVQTCERLFLTYTSDAARFARMAREQAERGDRFRDALTKLVGETQ